MPREGKELVVATFSSLEQAEEALSDISQGSEDVRHGALLLRDLSGEVYIREANLATLGDLVRGGVDLGAFLMVGGVGIILDSLLAGAGLLLRGTGRAANLAGLFVTTPIQRARAAVFSNRNLVSIGESLLPGAAAVAVQVDAGSGDEVRQGLSAHGGRVQEADD